jgi:tryptophanyl-tRNA synthetase
MKKRLLSGMRPTGPLHLGNYHGALANWVRLQDEYDCFFFVADWHALTSDYEKPDSIKGYTTDILLDWLSAGLTPEKSTLFIQSRIKEHAELFLIWRHHAGAWLKRNPTTRTRWSSSAPGPSTFALGYPVLQAADIIMYKPTGCRWAIRHPMSNHPGNRPALQLFLRTGASGTWEVIPTETPKLLGTDRAG